MAADLFANDDARDAAKSTADLVAIATDATNAASNLLQIASAALDALRAVDARQSEPNVTTELQDAWRGVYAGGPPPHPPRLATSPPSLIILTAASGDAQVGEEVSGLVGQPFRNRWDARRETSQVA